MPVTGQAAKTTTRVLEAIELKLGKLWSSAANRALLHTRATSVKSYIPHLTEGKYSFRTMAESDFFDVRLWIVEVIAEPNSEKK